MEFMESEEKAPITKESGILRLYEIKSIGIDFIDELKDEGVYTIGSLLTTDKNYLFKKSTENAKIIINFLNAEGLYFNWQEENKNKVTKETTLENLKDKGVLPLTLYYRFNFAGLKTIKDYTNLTESELNKLRGIGPVKAAQIKDIFTELGFKLKQEGNVEKKSIINKETTIEELHEAGLINTFIYHQLKRASWLSFPNLEVNTIGQIMSYTKKELLKIPRFGEKSYNKLMNLFDELFKPKIVITKETTIEELQEAGLIDTCTYDQFKKVRINNVGSITRYSRDQLLKIPNLDEKKVGKLTALIHNQIISTQSNQQLEEIQDDFVEIEKKIKEKTENNNQKSDLLNKLNKLLKEYKTLHQKEADLDTELTKVITEFNNLGIKIGEIGEVLCKKSKN